MSASETFRGGGKVVDPAEDQKEREKEEIYLRPGKVLTATTNIVKRGKEQKRRRNRNNSGQSRKSLEVMQITRVVEEGVEGHWVNDPMMESQFFHFSRLYGWEEEEMDFLEEKAKKYPMKIFNFGNELMEVICRFLRGKEIVTFISGHKVTMKHHEKLVQSAKEAYEKAKQELSLIHI